MGTASFKAAFERGEPLADVVVKYREWVNAADATEQLNLIAEDFDLHLKPWYDDPRLRLASATRDALLRLFGWKLIRAQVPNNPGLFWWKEVNGPLTHPPGFEDAIESLGLTQPGADDDGQWYEYE